MNVEYRDSELPFRDIGQCIYCGDKTSPLSREHVLPKGLDGANSPRDFHDALVLRNASCESCRKNTQTLELEVLRNTLDTARQVLGIKGKEQRGKRVTAHLESFDGTSEMRELDITDVPVGIVLPTFEKASIVESNTKKSVYSYGDIVIRIISKANPALVAKYRRVGGVGIQIEPARYAQMLAKIALGVAVARYGIDGFEPLVGNFVIGNKKEFGHWVGRADPQDVSFSSEDFHCIALKEKATSNGSFIFAYIQLFAEFSCPIHYVIVGRPKVNC